MESGWTDLQLVKWWIFLYWGWKLQDFFYTRNFVLVEVLQNGDLRSIAALYMTALVYH